jgi:hypothetical protein
MQQNSHSVQTRVPARKRSGGTLHHARQTCKGSRWAEVVEMTAIKRHAQVMIDFFRDGSFPFTVIHGRSEPSTPRTVCMNA